MTDMNQSAPFTHIEYQIPGLLEYDGSNEVDPTVLDKERESLLLGKCLAYEDAENYMVCFLNHAASAPYTRCMRLRARSPTLEETLVLGVC